MKLLYVIKYLTVTSPIHSLLHCKQIDAAPCRHSTARESFLVDWGILGDAVQKRIFPKVCPLPSAHVLNV